MKLTIKNYKTLKNTSIDIKENEINFLIGSNESGKTNILNAICCLDEDNVINISSKDKTFIESVPENEDISFEFSYEKNPEISNFIDDSKVHIWLNKSLSYYNNYKKLMTDNISKMIIDLKNFNNDKIVNWDTEDKETPNNKKLIKKLKEFNIIVNKIGTDALISNDELEIFKAFIRDNEIEYKNYKLFFDTYLNFYQEIQLDRPRVYFVQPMANAFKDEPIIYPWSDLSKSNSLLYKIFSVFSDDKSTQHLNQIYNNDPNNENIQQSSNVRKNEIIEKINEKIKKYFQENLKLLKGCPKFFIDGSTLMLTITSNTKEKLKIDSGDEYSRSLGFKSFLRIILEIKALSSTTKEKVIYIIDEPEQGLHPFLQILLMTEIKKIAEDNNNNITFLLSSHSPYIISIDEVDKLKKNLNFVIRILKDDKELISGETIIKNLRDKEFIESLQKSFAESIDKDGLLNNYTEDIFLFKMLLDSKTLTNSNKVLKKEIKNLHKKRANKEIEEAEFQKEMMELTTLKNNASF